MEKRMSEYYSDSTKTLKVMEEKKEGKRLIKPECVKKNTNTLANPKS